MIFLKIEELCRQNDLSISKLEKILGLGNATIKGWQNSIPRADNLRKVADYFDVPIEYFLEE